MQKYAVGAEWRCEAAPTEAVQALVAEHLAGLNPCIWEAAEAPNLLHVSFDVLAADYDEALATGRAGVLAVMARAGVDGTLLLLGASTVTGQVTWGPDDV